MKNVISNKNELQEVVASPFYIWGAGDSTRCLLRWLAETDCQPLGVLVSPNHNLSVDMGVEVTAVDTFETDANIIVAVKEETQKEVESIIKKIRCANVYYIDDTFREYLFFKYYHADIHKENMIKNLGEEVRGNFRNMLRFIAPPRVPYLAVGIVDHCNLKCKGCTHFSCIAEEYIVPAEKVCADIRQLGKIFENKRIDTFAIMGGEPLLHPELIQITKCVRDTFREAEVQIVTNGILLLKESSEFWNMCRENRITIICTKYPINLKFDDIEKKAAKEQVDFQYYGDTGNVTKILFKREIDLQGRMNPVQSFATCWEANECNFLMEGKWFECPFICFAERVFNKKFNQHIKIEEKDYIDIYQVEDYHEILEYMAKPKDACRFCKGFHGNYLWETSKEALEEWV